MPSLDLFENVIRVSQMVVQGSWATASPLLQLPHLLPSHLKHFKTRKVGWLLLGRLMVEGL